jgi:DNA modification methylase
VTAAVIRGDARHLPLPDASVDLIVTSPPYFGLRDYGYAGQIGSEGTPTEWLEALWACTAEWVRVLKPEGSLFVNLGDKYAGSDANSKPHTGQAMINGPHGSSKDRIAGRLVHDRHRVTPGRPKTLLGLPWRYAIGCMDRLGLILRAEVIWAKPNGLPESVTDRVRRSHEQVFHFTRSPRYYAAVDEIREPYSENKPWGTGENSGRKPAQATAAMRGTSTDQQQNGLGKSRPENPLGKLPGSVWEIAPDPVIAELGDVWKIPSSPLQVPAWLGVDHFAAFPPALVRPVVLGWSPPGVCTACAQGRRPVAISERIGTDALRPPVSLDRRVGGHHGMGSSTLGPRGVVATITGYACACPEPDAPTRPALVLDPFGGTGTTALVASAYGRHAITVDLSAAYCRLARWRVNDPGERARARAMPKPPPVPDGMEPLFTMEGA